MKTIADVAVGPFPPCRRTTDKDYQTLLSLLCAEHGQYKIETDGKYEDMIHYYTVWAHQIKTPLAAMRLHLQNDDSPLSRQLMLNLHRVEQYVAMVLTFLRLNTESTDYVIREQDLDRIVRQAVRKFSAEFIARRLSLVYEPLHVQVITDEKWLSFVIEQLLSNALKYTPSGSISITWERNNTLCIRDTGLGIAPEGLPRIFENGYTSCHGRTDKQASGIGLYLCKRICENLGHTIAVQSEMDVGTTVSLHLARQRLILE